MSATHTNADMSNVVAKTKEAKQKKSKSLGDLSAEFGIDGILNFRGFIDNELNKDLVGRRGVEEWDKMLNTNATIKAIFLCVTLPIISADWYIKPASEEAKDVELKDFSHRAFFEELESSSGQPNTRGSFVDFLRQALFFKALGVIAFEKVFKVVDTETGPKVFWQKFATRHPKTYERFELDNGDLGIVQLNITGNPEKRILEMPWTKMVVFINDLIGSDWWGKSMFRSAHGDWRMVDLLTRLDMVAAERYAVGTPMIAPPTGLQNDKNQAARAKEMAQSFRSSEKSFVFKPSKDWEYGILEAGMKSRDLMPSIKFHTERIAEVALADFLLLGQGDSGSYALSKDKTEFFTMALRATANYIAATLNSALRELVDMNYDMAAGQEYPELCYKNLTAVDIATFSTGMMNLTNSGIVSPDEGLERYVRELIGLPERDESTEYKDPEDKTKQVDKLPEDQSDVDEENPQASRKYQTVMAAASEPMIKRREREFVSGITQNERFIRDMHKLDLERLDVYEEGVKKSLADIYRSAKTEVKDGIVVLSSTGNQAAKSEIRAVLKDTESKMDAYFNSTTRKDRYFKQVWRNAKDTFSSSVDVLKQTADVFDDRNQTIFNSFIRDYKSNVEAFSFNETRRVAEMAELNFGGTSSVDQVMKQIEAVQFNRNTYALSTASHGRAYYKNLMYNAASEQGFVFYKMLLPDNVDQSEIDPSGMTAGLLYSVYTIAQWNRKTNDKNTNTVSALGLHHGSQEYYRPVPSEDLDDELAYSRLQRKDLKAVLQ